MWQGLRVGMLAHLNYKPPKNLFSMNEVQQFNRKPITQHKLVWHYGDKCLWIGLLHLVHSRPNQNKLVGGTSSTLWSTKCWCSADNFLAGENCTLDKRVQWSSFLLEIQLMKTKSNQFFSGPQDISAVKVAEIHTFALLQEPQWWSEKEVWSRWVYLESASWDSCLTAGVCCPRIRD